MSRHIDISAELLLSLCQTGAKFFSPEDTIRAECVQGVSDGATVMIVEVLLNNTIRVHFNDPQQPEGSAPALWRRYTEGEVQP